MRTSFVLGPIRSNFWNLQFSDSRVSARDHLFVKIYVLNNQPWFSSWLFVTAGSASWPKLITTQKACFKQPREYAPGKESENQQLWRGYRYIDIYDDRSHANRIHLCRSHYCLWVIDDDLQLTIVSRMRGKPSHMVHEHPIAYAVEDHIEPDNVQTFLPKQLLNPALNVTYAVVGAQFLRRGGFAF